MKKFILVFLAVFFLATISVFAQDLTNQERINISSPGVGVDWPYAAVNGKGETGVFFMWFGGSGSPDGIAFRKLDKKGIPLGPQKFAYKTNPSETRGFDIWDVVYSDGSYYVLIKNRIQKTLLLFSFTEDGQFLSKARYKQGEREELLNEFLNLSIFGNSVYVAVTSGEDWRFFRPLSDKKRKEDNSIQNFLLKVDMDKPDKFEKIELLPPGNKRIYIHGSSVDADNIVILLSELWLAADYENINPGIISYNPVTGEKSEIKYLDCHKEIASLLFFFTNLVKPVYNGAGHLMFYTTLIENDYYHSYVFNNKGETVSGPVSLGQTGNFHDLYDSDLVGSFTFFGIHEPFLDAVLSMMIGKKGKHTNNIYYEENREDSFFVGSLGQVFTGNNVVFIYRGISGYIIGPANQDQGIFIYTKSIPTPSPIKDGISFFQAGSKNFADGSRHLIWSTVGSESVTIKHNGQEYTNLPPQYSFQLKDVNSKKPAELTFTSAAGKTYSRKLGLK